MDASSNDQTPAATTPRKAAPGNSSLVVMRIIAALFIFGAISGMGSLAFLGDMLKRMGVHQYPWYVITSGTASLIAGVLMWRDQKAGIYVAILIQAAGIPMTFVQMQQMSLPGALQDNPMADTMMTSMAWFTALIGVGWIVGLVALLRARERAKKDAAFAAETDL